MWKLHSTKKTLQFRMLSSVKINCQVFNCQNCNRCLKCHKSPELSFQLSKLSKIVKKLLQLSKIVAMSQLSKTIKFVKKNQICQNKFQFCQKKSNLSEIVKICPKKVNMLVRSCFLISLIKCLKGRKYLGSLFVCLLVKS